MLTLVVMGIIGFLVLVVAGMYCFSRSLSSESLSSAIRRIKKMPRIAMIDFGGRTTLLKTLDCYEGNDTEAKLRGFVQYDMCELRYEAGVMLLEYFPSRSNLQLVIMHISLLREVAAEILLEKFPRDHSNIRFVIWMIPSMREKLAGGLLDDASFEVDDLHYIAAYVDSRKEEAKTLLIGHHLS